MLFMVETLVNGTLRCACRVQSPDDDASRAYPYNVMYLGVCNDTLNPVHCRVGQYINNP